MPDGQRWEIPVWIRLLGLTSWYGIGMVAALVVAAWFVSATRTIIIPFVVAVLLSAILSPVADILERRGMKRWVGALLATLLVVVVGAGLVLLIVAQVVNQAPEIGDQLSAATADLAAWLDEQGWGSEVITSVESSVAENWQKWLTGIIPTIGRGVGSLATLVLVVVLAVNILFFLIKDGPTLSRWAAGHLGVPREIAAATFADSSRSIRGYFIGTTAVGLVNAVIVGVGAVVLGTPLAFVLAVVMLFTNYVPFIGAFVGGAFAVLIAFAGGGVTDAAIMLGLVLAANGPGQWVVQPLALGSSLNLHPIVVLFVTMAGSILAGPVGGVVSAPLTAVMVDGVRRVNAAGLFSGPDPAAAAPTADAGGGP
ncbi:MAG: AI-2E family transporter [Thermoleophilia bacterium]|jgi:predicted PurR-regulated permease PerM|nr:AI-2E family transporter [Thermoleophilia bacterium]